MLVALFAVAVLAVVKVDMPSDVNDIVAVQNSFVQFQQAFGKTYATNEIQKRFDVFAANVKDIAVRNAARKGDHEAVFGITRFSDLTRDEFASTVLMSTPRVVEKEKKIKEHLIANKRTLNAHGAATVPNTFDWRSRKAVTPVKDQGQCGSCWAFSTVENIESVWILAGKANASTLRLAPQQLVDCSDIDFGCNGGNPPDAYESVYYEGGLETEAQYPYTAVTGSCELTNGQASAGSVQIATWKLVSGFFDEHAMQAGLLRTAPLSVCVDATNWQNYQSGVMTASQCAWINMLDHCVQLVGYNQTASTPYWIVRNSWAESWGIMGYIYLEMWQQTCGIGYEATSSVL